MTPPLPIFHRASSEIRKEHAIAKRLKSAEFFGFVSSNSAFVPKDENFCPDRDQI
jgi:hypothetical protein